MQPMAKRCTVANRDVHPSGLGQLGCVSESSCTSLIWIHRSCPAPFLPGRVHFNHGPPDSLILFSRGLPPRFLHLLLSPPPLLRLLFHPLSLAPRVPRTKNFGFPAPSLRSPLTAAHTHFATLPPPVNQGTKPLLPAPAPTADSYKRSWARTGLWGGG
jgi:hypothetical protein